MAIPKILKELLTLPTATFQEQCVKEYVFRFCERLNFVTASEREFGNILVKYSHNPPPRRPLVFAAHMDHPGFIALDMLDARTVRAAFRGGVRSEYFLNSKVRFHAPEGPVGAAVRKITQARKIVRGKMIWHVPEEALLRVERPVPPGAIGMWDLPDPVERDGNIHARACDDIAGCAAMLALLERLSKKQAPAEVYCLFTRAEEVGFIGAIGAARAGTISKDWPIVAIETSSELPHARIGDGPILRAGDRMSVFDPAVTAFCERVAKTLAAKRKSFKYQRKLMDGGSCESTAYLAYGYPATGICLALGNYHNMHPKRHKPSPEFISLNDWKLMVDWFEALALDERGFQGADGTAREDFDKSFDKWKAFF